MLFTRRFWPGIADGSVTVTVRRWIRPQVVASRTYRTPAGRVVVEAVEEITESEVTDDDARRAGFPHAAALVTDLPEPAGDRALFRVRFHRATDPDPRAALAGDAALTPWDVADLDQRLDRLDAASRLGPWTARVLDVIADRPATRAGDLATDLGLERDWFKLQVRKLKALGLTESLDVGYRLSPRGEAYRRASG